MSPATVTDKMNEMWRADVDALDLALRQLLVKREVYRQRWKSCGDWRTGDEYRYELETEWVE